MDLTDAVDLTGREERVLVVRVEDDPRDVTQPRGKQDWHDAPHGIWYLRTSGIWQTVWAEVVPPVAVEHLGWTPDVPSARVHLGLELSAPPLTPGLTGGSSTGQLYYETVGLSGA